MSQHNPVFDIMKGIGILLMLMGHVPGLPIVLKSIIYSFHMPLFFLLAGFFSKETVCNGNLKNSILKDLKRLILPFVFTQFLLIIWTFIQYVCKHNPDMLIRASLSLLWGGADVIDSRWGHIFVCHLWFLPALFVAKTTFSLLRRKLDGMPLMLVCVLISLAANLAESLFRLPWCILQGLSAMTFIALGWWAKYKGFPLWLSWLMVGCWPVAIIFGGLEMYSCSYAIYPLDVLGACGGTIVVWWLSKCISKVAILARPLLWSGKYSLVLLCSHTFEWLSAVAYSLIIHSPFTLNENWMLAFRYALVFVMTSAIVNTPFVREIYGIKKSSK